METVRLTVKVDIEILDTDVAITAYYVEEQDIWAFIVNIDATINTIPFVQYEGGIIADDKYNFFLNNNGDLLVTAEDALQFSINDDGYLIQQL